MIATVEEHREELTALCRRYGVRQLALFGSAAAGAFRGGDSDLDFLVEFDAPDSSGYADRYFGMLEALEALFGTRVDLVVDSAIRNPYFRASVDETRTLLYAA